MERVSPLVHLRLSFAQMANESLLLSNESWVLIKIYFVDGLTYVYLYLHISLHSLTAFHFQLPALMRQLVVASEPTAAAAVRAKQQVVLRNLQYTSAYHPKRHAPHSLPPGLSPQPFSPSPPPAFSRGHPLPVSLGIVSAALSFVTKLFSWHLSASRAHSRWKLAERVSSRRCSC